jgi:nitrate/TMAO reductase-like tetraheme cytochrome c subunit
MECYFFVYRENDCRWRQRLVYKEYPTLSSYETGSSIRAADYQSHVISEAVRTV